MEDGKLGRYEIRGTLGKGAMGTVYEGWDPIVRRQVAIKTVRLPDPNDAEAQEEIARFRIEAQAGGRLNHPNICGIFDYGETDEIAYIVMEFIDGHTLKSSLDKDERFPVAETIRIMDGLLAGLQYSHDRQVVHRDIKPANVMLTTDGQVKIADFGIARIEQGHLTQAGAVLGTPAYMSPEQFMGNPVDSRTDIYSAGVVLYQLLTGERPFEGGFSAIMHKALNTEPPQPSVLSVAVPRGFDHVVAVAMAKRPAERYPTAAAFAEAVRGAPAANAAPVADQPPGDWGDLTIASNTVTRTRLPGGQMGGQVSGTMASPGGTASADPLATVATYHGTAAAELARGSAASQADPTKPSRMPVMIGAGVLLLAVAGAGGWYMTRPAGTAATTPPETLVANAGGNGTSTGRPGTQAGAPSGTQSGVPSVVASAVSPPVAAPAATTPPAAATSPQPGVATAPPGPIVTAMGPPSITPPVSQPPVSQPPVSQPPVSQPPTPPAPAPIPVAALANALAAIPCSMVGGDVTQPNQAIQLNGLAHTGQPEAAVRKVLSDLAPGAPNDWQVTAFDGPYCRPLDLLRPLATRFGEPGAGFVLALAGDRATLADGDLITLHMTTPDFPSYLQVDYLQHDGSVYHMHPTPTDRERVYPAGSRQSLGDPTAGGARWEVSEPYGTEIITAIATSVPLFAKQRPESETGDAYLRDLQTAIDAAKKRGARFVVGAVILKTQPKKQ